MIGYSTKTEVGEYAPWKKWPKKFSSGIPKAFLELMLKS